MSKYDWYSERQALLNKEKAEMDKPLLSSNVITTAVYNDLKWQEQLNNREVVSNPVSTTTQTISEETPMINTFGTTTKGKVSNGTISSLLKLSDTELLNVDLDGYIDTYLTDNDVVETTTQTTSEDTTMTLNTRQVDTGIVYETESATLNECVAYGIDRVLNTSERINLKEYNASLLNNDEVVETPVETTTQVVSKDDDNDYLTSVSKDMLHLRLDKGLSWKKCRATLKLSNSDFHKGIRLTSVYKETAIQELNTRIASGWTTKRDLSILTGIDNIESMLNNDVVVPETTTQTESKPVVSRPKTTTYTGSTRLEQEKRKVLNTRKVVETKTTKRTTSVDEKLNALLATFGK